MKRSAIFLLLYLPLVIFGQSISQNLERSGRIFVGTPFKLHINIETAIDDSIYSPHYDSLDVFFLKGDPVQTESIENEKVLTKVTLTFQAFDTGEYYFPELEFLVKNGDEQSVLKTKEFVVIVESVVPDSAQGIQDIAAPVKLKFSFWDYFIVFLAILLVVLIIYLIKWLIKKNQKLEIIPEKKDTRPSYLKALQLLESIDFYGILQSGNFVEYHYQLSIVLRYFLEDYYNFNALEMTTSEIRKHIKNKDISKEVFNLLQDADKVKFAKFIPQTESAIELLNWLKSYLNSFANDEKLREEDNA